MTRFALAVSALLLLTACLGKGPGTEEAADPESLAAQPAASLGVYVGFDALKDKAGDDASALAWLMELRTRRGVSLVAVQTRDARGNSAFESVGDGDVDRFAAAALERLLRFRKDVGLSLVAAHPVFLGPPAEDEELQTWRRREDGEAALATHPQRLNPSVPEVREREIETIAALASLDFDAIMLTHAGFPGPGWDLSDHARRAVEARTGQTLKDWPAVVLTEFDGQVLRGPAWSDWTVWRAEMINDFLIEADVAMTRAAEAQQRPRAPLMAMVDAYYPLHFYEGINWASNAAPARRMWTDAPLDYGRSAVGDLLDGIFLKTSAPLPSLADAEEAETVWWSSIEGALALAREALPRDIPHWTVLPITPYLNGDGDLDAASRTRLFQAASEAASASDGVLLLDVELAEEADVWGDIGAGIREAANRSITR